jgi:hypothetical protein
MRERVKCVPKLLGAAILLAAGLSIVPHARAQTAVGLELALLADVSASVSTAEYNLMLQGYVQAFQSAAVQEAIINGPGSIAVTYIEWSAGTQQSVQVNWTLINSAATANAFAAALAGSSRAFTGGNTAPGSAINFAYPLFSSNAYTSDRQVIDIAGDGAQNTGANTAAARDAAIAAGIDTINGLAVLGETGLEAWYNANIKAGTNAFVEPATDFDAFALSLRNKLVWEITNVPEPMGLGVLAVALVGLGIARLGSSRA